MDRTTLDDKTLSAICRRAIELIQERGWRRGLRRPGETSLCAGEALRDARTELGRTDALHDLFRAVKPAGLHLVPWNDRIGRTEEEVLDLLRSKVL